MFSYSYKRGENNKIRRELKFNPLTIGFKLIKKLNCCLHFKRDDYLLRVKTETQMIILEKEGRSRPLLGGTISNSQQSFEKKNRRCYLQ